MVDPTSENPGQPSEREVYLAYYRALEAAQFRGGFLARTAHELRSPLNKAISLHQMVLEGLCDDPEEEREFVAAAQAASLKLLEYLDFLIRVSKIEAGRLQPQLQSVALANIFEQVKDMTHLQAADRNLKLIVVIPDPSATVWADPIWLSNALITLIDIAVDSSDRGTIRLTIDPASPSDRWHIWVEDDRPVDHWKESIALPILQDFDLSDTLSSGLRMGMAEAMLRAMGGTLMLLSTTHASENAVTRLQCDVPRSPQD